ncbi:MAG: MBL fold metallo-hydrolase [Spirochaetes bacterium]|nr:MBL fold metallo-hydrolase [Spirochaetota bacterium]
MYLKFYGVRGSIPTPISIEEYQSKLKEILEIATPQDIQSQDSINNFLEKLPFYLSKTYGGNTACVYIKADDTHLIFDMGSGIKRLGTDLLTKEFGRNSDNLNIFVSHTHWDHIQGLPFFVPAYLEGNTINIYSPLNNLKECLEMQQYTQFFPVSMEELGSNIIINKMLVHKKYKIGNCEVSSIKLNHPNSSYAFKVEYNGKKIVYATDSEFNEQSLDYYKECIEFFEGTDVLIFDSQYTSKESFEKLHWGHSSANTAIDIGLKSKAKSIAFFHHEPNYTDKKLSELYDEATNYRNVISKENIIDVFPAYDGLEINLQD